MPSFVSNLNSAAPHTGTKATDTTVDIFRTHFTKEGRLPHSEHDTYPNGVCEIIGSVVRCNPSAWLVRVKRLIPIDSFQEFNTTLQISYNGPIDVPFSGDGSVVGIVKYNPVQAGAVTSNDGTTEVELRWVSGGDGMTDAQLDAAVAPDFGVRMCDVTAGIVTQGPVVQMCMPGGADYQGGCITGLCENPSDPTAPVTNNQLNTLYTLLGNSILLTVDTNNLCFPYYLSWTGTLTTSGYYEVWRNGTNVSGALSPSTTTWVDYDFTAAAVSYEIKQIDPIAGTFDISNTVGVLPTNCFVPRTGDFGDGFDGSINQSGGNITLYRGQVYRYTDVVFDNTTVNMSGVGSTVVLVDGDLSITGTTIIGNLTTNNDLNTAGYGSAIMVMTGGCGTHGSGGQGANHYPFTSSTGIGGGGGSGTITDAVSNVAPYGGYNTWPNAYGEEGHNAATTNLFAAAGGGGGAGGTVSYGGRGGRGGALSGLQPGLLFLVSGDIIIDSATTFIGNGANGGNGYPGSIGGYNSTGARYGGSGGGGGAAAGGDGMHFYFLAQGAQTIGAYTLTASGGAGGTGGVSIGHPSLPSLTVGSSGTNGGVGANGSVQIITI